MNRRPRSYLGTRGFHLAPIGRLAGSRIREVKNNRRYPPSESTSLPIKINDPRRFSILKQRPIKDLLGRTVLYQFRNVTRCFYIFRVLFFPLFLCASMRNIVVPFFFRNEMKYSFCSIGDKCRDFWHRHSDYK